MRVLRAGHGRAFLTAVAMVALTDLHLRGRLPLGTGGMRELNVLPWPSVGLMVDLGEPASAARSVISVDVAAAGRERRHT